MKTSWIIVRYKILVNPFSLNPNQYETRTYLYHLVKYQKSTLIYWFRICQQKLISANIIKEMVENIDDNHALIEIRESSIDYETAMNTLNNDEKVFLSEILYLTGSNIVQRISTNIDRTLDSKLRDKYRRLTGKMLL